MLPSTRNNAPPVIQLTVGQEVGVKMHNRLQTGWVVLRVTPSGQSVCKRTADGCEMRFNNQGYEMGKGIVTKQYASRLISGLDLVVTIASDEQQKLRDTAARLIREVVVQDMKGSYGKAYMQTWLDCLEGRLKAARAAVEALQD